MGLPVGDHCEKAPSGMLVFGVLLEVFSQFLDFRGQKSYLYLRRSGVLCVDARVLDYSGFLCR